MLRIFATETFKEIQLDKSLKLRYAISNYGRLVSFKETLEEGKILKGSVINGYRILRYQIRQEGKIKTQHTFFYNLVAQQFLTKTSEEQLYVLHLDRNRGNDFVDNLKRATREEMLEHSRNSPYVKEGRKTAKEKRKKADGSKLTETNVMWLKKRLLDPKRKTRLKMYAKQFGVSEMQLHRIRTGENWGHIKIDESTTRKESPTPTTEFPYQDN